MRKIGLIVICMLLATGCMTKDRWVNNPVSDFTYSYEEEYKMSLKPLDEWPIFILRDLF
ncbi:hypothetical protein MASR2M36_04540 [Providencia sp.]